jgi:chaperonin GroEL
MLRGLDLIANVVRPTLGPRPRYVAYENVMRTKTPELLSDAGTLARRIVQVSDGPSDVGAMLIRQAVWQVGDRVGDGSATTAVLAQAMVHRAYRSVAAGANAMRVRDGIQRGVSAAVQALRAQATPVESQAALTAIARSNCHDDGLAKVLGEIFSIVGTSGYVDVQLSRGRTLEREYVEGAFWRNTGWISSTFADMAMKRAELQDAVVMMVDGRIKELEPMVHAMQRVLSTGSTNIAIICRGMSDPVIGLLAHNHTKGSFKCLPIQTPASSYDRKSMFDDLVVMLGGEVFCTGDDADMTLYTPEMLGRVRRIWAQVDQYGFVSGRGSPKALREHIASLRRSLASATAKDDIQALRKRLGRLMGGTAVIEVGAATESEQKLRQDMAERSVRFMQSVAEHGSVAGGGAAFLACQPAIRSLDDDDPDVRAGVGAVVRALEEPMRAIAANAGEPASAAVARAKRCGAGYGLNVYTHQIEDMRAAGILDSANVAEQALITAGSVASMVLTTDVVVRHRKLEFATEP